MINGQVVVSEAGELAREEWLRSADIRSEIELDAFVVMPEDRPAIEAGETVQVLRFNG